MEQGQRRQTDSEGGTDKQRHRSEIFRQTRLASVQPGRQLYTDTENKTQTGQPGRQLYTETQKTNHKRAKRHRDRDCFLFSFVKYAFVFGGRCCTSCHLEADAAHLVIRSHRRDILSFGATGVTYCHSEPQA